LGGEGYPKLLAEIPDPPAVLYTAGEIDSSDELAVAVVGSRKASTHGLRFAARLAQDLAAAGVTVVSGLAQGIDAAAHRGALEVGGRTLAVFGAGLDVIYPGWNAPLASDVRANGAWLSEFCLGSEPLAHHFPQRNRVISGLSLGVVVVEAAERSGSLITAETALEQGRDVFAVPGLPGSFNARGTHSLLRCGAKLVETAADILEELPARGRSCQLQGHESATAPRLPVELEGVWRALEDVPLHIDDVGVRSGLSATRVAVALMELCLLGGAEEWPGKRYTRRPIEGQPRLREPVHRKS
jgi:DNA processing protein